MPNSREVRAVLERNYLDVNGFVVPVIAGINKKGRTEPFMFAKGSPVQLQEAVTTRVEQATQAELDDVDSHFAARLFLSQAPRISTDCSAFVFHAVDELARQQGEDFASYITIPRGEVWAAARKKSWKEKHQLTLEERFQLTAMGRRTPLRWVTETYGKPPAFLTNVERMGSNTASMPVELAEVQPADILIMRDDVNHPHAAIVVDVDPEKGLSFWDSNDTNNGDFLGGMGSHEITIVDLSKPIDEQRWSHLPFLAQFSEIEIRRPMPFVA